MKRQLALAFALALAYAVSAQATVRYVPSQYATIQAAVNAAQTGDVVQIAPGTYTDLVILTHTPPTPPDTCMVVMKSGITLRGAGAGATILDGQYGVPGQYHRRGILCDNVTGAVIEEMTIKRCLLTTYGSGVFCRNYSSPTIRNCEFTQNFDGAVICLDYSSPTITNCRMLNNASKGGGAIAVDTYCNPTIADCVITGNSAPEGGGILVHSYSSPIIRNCLIANNSISEGAGSGGGLSIGTSTVTVQDCLILDNVAKTGGGGIWTQDSTVLTLTNCLVQGNRCISTDVSPGGGVFIDFNSEATLQDCTITRNWVESTDPLSVGAGVAVVAAGNVIIRGCTIAYNGIAGSTQASGIDLKSPASIEKCLIAFNSPGSGMSCLDGAVPSVSCTDVYGNAGGNTICGTDLGHNFSLDPFFCDAATNDFHLQSASPCAPGHHPDGPAICDGSRLGSQGVGCGTGSGVNEGAGVSARLLGNDPNPFSPATTIRFDLSRAGHVSLRIFDVAGRQVRLLTDRMLGAGAQHEVWNGRNDSGQLLPSGIYFARLNAGGTTQTRHMVLSR